MGLLTPSHSLAFLIASFHENSRANRTHVQFYRFNRLWRSNASRRSSGVTFTHIGFSKSIRHTSRVDFRIWEHYRQSNYCEKKEIHYTGTVPLRFEFSAPGIFSSTLLFPERYFSTFTQQSVCCRWFKEPAAIQTRVVPRDA